VKLVILKRLTVPLAIAGLPLMTPAPAAADTTAPFDGTYSGNFTITFGGCSDGDNHLQFNGTGRAIRVGQSTVSGDSCLRQNPARPNCAIVEEDNTTITNADGGIIRFRNQGRTAS
jgi:hypothetical protein